MSNISPSLRRVNKKFNNLCIILIIFLRDMRSTPQVLCFIDFRYYDGDNKNRLNRTNRIPFVVGREIFPYKGESRGPFEPTALVIAVNQFRHEIDSKSQVPQTFAVLLLFLFLSFFRTSRCLRDTRSTTKKLKFHRLSHFMGACEVDQSFILKVLCTHA